jgi:site-specific DNA recombinase
MSVRHSTPVRAVAYFRMSDDDQEGSIEQQQAWARTAAQKENATVVAEFIDSGLSGTSTAHRPDFQRMLDFCREQHRLKKPIDVILCWNPNRFSRADSQETNWFIWEFRKVGCGLMLTASDGWIDFADDNDRLIFNIKQDTSNHQFIKNLARDVLRGKLAAAREGRRNGGRAPFGYRLVYEVIPGAVGRRARLTKLVIHEEQAAIVREMFRAYAAGETSLYRLAQDLNARGIKPGRAAKWVPTTVRQVLRNEVYLGALVWNQTDQARFFGIVDMEVKPKKGTRTVAHPCFRRPSSQHVRTDGHHEAIIDRDTFDRVQQLLVEKRKGRDRADRGLYILRTLLRCGTCGGPMVGKRQEWGEHKAHYRCGTYNLDGPRNRTGCPATVIYEEPLVSCIAQKLQSKVFNKGRLAELEKEMKAAIGDGKGDGQAEARARREVAALKEKLEKASERYLTEQDEEVAALHRAALQQLLDRKHAVEASLADAATRKATEPDVEALIARAMEHAARLEKAFAAMDRAALRAALRDMIDRVEVFFRKVEHAPGRAEAMFVRGLVWLKPGVLPEPCQLNTSLSPR